MSIVVQCPHCKTRFTLQKELNGKSMRCPNLECRQVFTVNAMAEKGPAPSYEPPPAPEPPPKPKKPAAKPLPPEPTARPAAKPPKPAAPAKPPKPTKPVAPEVVEAEVVEAAVVSPPKVKEVVWSEGTDVPPPKKGKAVAAELDEPDEPADDLPIRRKKKQSRGPLLLAVMLVGIVAALVAAGFYILYNQDKGEKVLAAKAEEQYKKGEYGDAAKSFDKLAKDYGGSKDADKYKFFADLSSMQTVVRGVTNREDYDPGVKRLAEFVEAQKESPLAKPGAYALDILEAGKLLGEAIGNHAKDRVAAFKKDRTKSGELARADKAIETLEKLITDLDPFRGPDDPPLKKLKEDVAEAKAGVKSERDRLVTIAAAREKLASPTDAVIQVVETELATAGLKDDDEAVKLISDAKGRLISLVRYEEDKAAAQPAPPSPAASLLFVTPVGKPKPGPLPAKDPNGSVFLCVARGILYALDEADGALLWATRVSADVVDPPAVAKIGPAADPTELAVVPSNVGGAPAVSGVLLRTGVTKWYQPLPAAAAGPAVVIDKRAFVPTRDPLGAVYEFNLETGERLGKISLGQPLADRSAVLRPGTNLLYIAAEARRLYVLDTGGKDENGNQVNPRCAQVIATGHLPGTVRVPPIFVGPEGVEPADRWMVLAQAEGTSKTLLRTFAVGPLPPPPAAGASVPETPATHAAALPVPGWVTFPMVCDGERLAVATDTGHFRLFGINQPGNADKTLFPLPTPATPTLTGDKTAPGLVLPVEESTYLVLAAGQLQKARLTLVPSKGQSVVFDGAPLAAGEPLHAGQMNAKKNVACVAVRPGGSAGCRAVAIDMRDGEVRWQRQLGVVPAKLSADLVAPPIAVGDRFIMIDEDGAVISVPATGAVAAGQTVAAPAAWVLAPPPLNATGPTLVTTTPDGKLIYALTPVARDGPKFVVRRIADGKLALDDTVVATEKKVAGTLGIVGGSLLVPTDDGFVNRVVPGDGNVRLGKLEPGPRWLGERKPANPACALTVLSNAAFVTSDGGKVVTRWEWPAGANWSQAHSWTVAAEVVGVGAALPPAGAGDPPRLAVADVTGSVWLYAADRSAAPLKRWKAGENGVPPGKPGSALVAAGGKGAFAYVVDGKLVVGVDADAADALWVAKTGEDASAVLVGTPQSTGDGWLLTDLAGRVLLVSGADGTTVSAHSVGLPGAVPASPSAAAGGTALAPLSDGSAVVIELPKK